MGGATDAYERGGRICRAVACCLGMILALAGSAQASAPATPGQLAGLAAWHEGQIILAADGNLTFSVKSIDAEPGIEAPIAMILPSAAELRAAGAGEGTFLLIRNIPEGVSVSAGMATGRVWVVPLREAPTLRLLSKPGASAQFQLGFHLIGPNNRVLAETTVPVTLRPIQPVVAVGPAIPPRPETPLKPPAQTRPQAEPLSPQAEAVLLARGREVLEQGGIAAARIIFEELATHGSAAGALALARSYDPAYAGASRGSAPPPNLAEARKWYERAAELGNPDAKRRLAEIASGG